MNKSTGFLILTLMFYITSSGFQLPAQTIKKDTIKVYDIYYEDKKFLELEDKVYDMVEITAKFPGGQDALWAYIQASKKKANKNPLMNSEALVLVKCIIEKNGCITNAKILLSADDKFNNEALHIVNSMPQWKPAIQDGEPVRSFMTIPFRF